MPHVDIKLEQIPIQTPYRIQVEGAAIVVIRTETSIAAFRDRCPHAAWPISEGDVTNGTIECAGHGWQFDVTTGHCINAPAYCLERIPITIEADSVRIHVSAFHSFQYEGCSEAIT